LLQGHAVNRIVGPNETINAERVKDWCICWSKPAQVRLEPGGDLCLTPPAKQLV
jgi:hypothetical protein